MAALVAAVPTLMAMRAPALPPLHPMCPRGFGRRGGGGGRVLSLGFQGRREGEAQCRSESNQGKGMSPRDLVRFDCFFHRFIPFTRDCRTGLTSVEHDHLDGGPTKFRRLDHGGRGSPSIDMTDGGVWSR
jgi:hypothetical protein